MKEVFLAVLKRLGITKVVVEANEIRFATSVNNAHVTFEDDKLVVWLLDVDEVTPIYHEEVPYAEGMTVEDLGGFFKHYIMNIIGHTIPTLAEQVVSTLKDKNVEIIDVTDNFIEFYWGIYRFFITVAPSATLIENSDMSRQRIVRNVNGLNHIINIIMKFVKEEGQL